MKKKTVKYKQGSIFNSVPKAQKGKSIKDSEQEAAQQKQDEAIEWLNNWRNSPRGSEMLRNSTITPEEYERIYNSRTESLDRLKPIEFYEKQGYHPTGLPKSGVNSLNPITKTTQTYVYPFGIESPTTILHETGHAEDFHGKYIPKKDQELINSFRPESFEESPYAKSEQGKNLSKKEKEANKKYMKMYGDPKEVRQLINQVRFTESNDPNRVYDPFTEQVTPEVFEKMKGKVYEREDKNPLHILQKNFNDQQLIELFNTISANDSGKQSVDIAKQGGAIPKAQKGLWTTASLPSTGVALGSTTVSNEEINKIDKINKLAKDIVKKDPKKYTQKDLEILNQSTIKEAKKSLDNYKISKANAARKEGWSSPEKFAESTSAIGSKLSLQRLPIIGNYIPDELDVTRSIGDMGSGIGKVPQNIKEGNYGAAAIDIAIPLATGAIGGLGARTTGQFANNILNPLAGSGDILKKSKTALKQYVKDSGNLGIIYDPKEQGIQAADNLKKILKSNTENLSNESNFVSEIDWSKWNKDTPKYPELISEYNAIEEATKKSGTWMKNPDGSAFQGTPEQFIQQQTSWFKKAYPNGAEVTYRGTRGNDLGYTSERIAEIYPEGYGIFTGDLNTAKHYSGNPDNIFKKTGEDFSNKGGVHHLYHPKSNVSYNIDARGASGREVPIENLPGMKSNKTVGGSPVAVTDDIATWVKDNNVDYVNIRNVVDGPKADYVRVVNNKPGNYLKSTFGNVGFFDIWNNPDPYKALIPIIPSAAAATVSYKQNTEHSNNMRRKPIKYNIGSKNSEVPNLQFGDLLSSGPLADLFKSGEEWNKFWRGNIFDKSGQLNKTLYRNQQGLTPEKMYGDPDSPFYDPNFETGKQDFDKESKAMLYESYLKEREDPAFDESVWNPQELADIEAAYNELGGANRDKSADKEFSEKFMKMPTPGQKLQSTAQGVFTGLQYQAAYEKPEPVKLEQGFQGTQWAKYGKNVSRNKNNFKAQVGGAVDGNDIYENLLYNSDLLDQSMSNMQNMDNMLNMQYAQSPNINQVDYYNNLYQEGGPINFTGYTPGSQTERNKMNIIPGDTVTSTPENAPPLTQPVLTIANFRNIKNASGTNHGLINILKPGETKQVVGADKIVELPMKETMSNKAKYGSRVSNSKIRYGGNVSNIIQRNSIPNFQYSGQVGADENDEWIGRIMDFEARQGSQEGKGLSNFGYNKPRGYEKVNGLMVKKGARPNANGKYNPADLYEGTGKYIEPRNKQEAIARFKKEYLPDFEKYPIEIRKRLADYKYNSNRTPEHLLLYADGKITLDEINSDQPETIAYVNEQWKKHGNEIEKKLSNRDFVGKLNTARDKVAETTKRMNGQTNPAYEKTWYDRVRMFDPYKVTYNTRNVGMDAQMDPSMMSSIDDQFNPTVNLNNVNPSVSVNQSQAPNAIPPSAPSKLTGEQVDATVNSAQDAARAYYDAVAAGENKTPNINSVNPTAPTSSSPSGLSLDYRNAYNYRGTDVSRSPLYNAPNEAQRQLYGMLNQPSPEAQASPRAPIIAATDPNQVTPATPDLTGQNPPASTPAGREPIKASDIYNIKGDKSWEYSKDQNGNWITRKKGSNGDWKVISETLDSEDRIKEATDKLNRDAFIPGSKSSGGGSLSSGRGGSSTSGAQAPAQDSSQFVFPYTENYPQLRDTSRKAQNQNQDQNTIQPQSTSGVPYQSTRNFVFPGTEAYPQMRRGDINMVRDDNALYNATGPEVTVSAKRIPKDTDKVKYGSWESSKTIGEMKEYQKRRAGETESRMMGLLQMTPEEAAEWDAKFTTEKAPLKRKGTLKTMGQRMGEKAEKKREEKLERAKSNPNARKSEPRKKWDEENTTFLGKKVNPAALRRLNQIGLYQYGGEINSDHSFPIHPITEEFTEIQTERGETVFLPDGTIVNVKATDLHKNMNKDKVTDILPEGAYIFSNDDKMRFKLNDTIGGVKIKDMKLGKTVFEYKENQVTSGPTDIMLSDIFNGKDNLTPSEISNNIKKKFEVRDMKDDFFVSRANNENKVQRLEYLNVLKTFSEFKKPKSKREVPKAQYGLNMSDYMYNDIYNDMYNNTESIPQAGIGDLVKLSPMYWVGDYLVGKNADKKNKKLAAENQAAWNQKGEDLKKTGAMNIGTNLATMASAMNVPDTLYNDYGAEFATTQEAYNRANALNQANKYAASQSLGSPASLARFTGSNQNLGNYLAQANAANTGLLSDIAAREGQMGIQEAAALNQYRTMGTENYNQAINNRRLALQAATTAGIGNVGRSATDYISSRGDYNFDKAMNKMAFDRYLEQRKQMAKEKYSNTVTGIAGGIADLGMMFIPGGPLAKGAAKAASGAVNIGSMTQSPNFVDNFNPAFSSSAGNQFGSSSLMNPNDPFTSRLNLNNRPGGNYYNPLSSIFGGR